VPSPQQDRLRGLVTRLRQLTELRSSQRQQQHLVIDPQLRSGFAELLALLGSQIDILAGEIAALIEADPLWAELDRAFRSIKGVADRTVARLMAEMPEIGALSNKAISKLAGLAPMARDSGAYRGKRCIRGGRSTVRDILFVVASVVGRYESDFVAFAQRLRTAGKPPKVVRIALAHKLLIRLNAKAREVRARFALGQKPALAS
jgi:transposase